MIRTFWQDCIVFVCLSCVMALEPGSCRTSEYYEPGAMLCQPCPANASMVASDDEWYSLRIFQERDIIFLKDRQCTCHHSCWHESLGGSDCFPSGDPYACFACSCEEHSIPVTPGRCKPCGATAVVSSDGAACVPRRCQGVAGRTVCRKCPADYISVTQNFDGSPMKEVLCVKCARGFKSSGDVCVRCPGCACARNEVIVRGACVPRGFVNARQKYEGGLHPFALLDVVKYEYLCIQHNYRACRTLASECVKNFYTTEAAGPCRLWMQPNLVPHKGLPALLIESPDDKDPGIDLPRGEAGMKLVAGAAGLAAGNDFPYNIQGKTLKIVLGIHTSSGGYKLLQDPGHAISPCFTFLEINIGKPLSRDCHYNSSDMPLSEGDTLSPLIQMGGSLKPLPVVVRKPNGNPVKRATWPTDKFRRYFVTNNYLSTTTNSTNTIYLRTLLIHIRMQRSKLSLRVYLTIEAQYATKPAYSGAITTSLQVEHEMPSAGVLRGLEIWGGILGALLSCYALLQWRGVLRRGGPQAALLPLLAGSTADVMYFAVWLSTLHALAVESGSFELTLAPSVAEERIIRAFVYSAVALKVIKVAWMNWCQCRCDIFFLDWSEYNPPVKDEQFSEDNTWKMRMLAQEWSSTQARRRVSPGITITFALIVLHIFSPWLDSLPSAGYVWSAGCIGWWACYSTSLLASWVRDRLIPVEAVSRICEGVGMSLLVFEEEYYAHYVHGRNNGSPEVKTMSGPLQACRVACAPQLRVVYKQLSTPGSGALTEGETRQALLSRFLAAFFERALDGLSWVASERTVLERLLDVEIAVREAGNTSVLLYGPDDGAPSYLAVTWWGQEWTLATLDAMVFGCVLLAAGNWLLAALTTLILWQAMKHSRKWFGDRNLKQNIGIETMI